MSFNRRTFDVSFTRNEKDILGMTIGGGAPVFPVIYVVQVFPKGKVALDGTIEPGDELTHVNGMAVKGMTRVDVARVIKNSANPIRISGEKLAFEVLQGITLDVLFADMKHRLLDYISTQTADKFGLTRAMLVNDDFVKRFENLEQNEKAFKLLARQIRDVLKTYKELCSAEREIGDVFTELSQADQDVERRKMCIIIGEAHRQINKSGLEFIEEAMPLISDMNNFLRKVIPDTRRTIKQYLDIKYIFLSFCLKVQLMDDEEAEFTKSRTFLPRLAEGNKEYRVALRCQYMAKARFMAMRQNVIEKLYLTDNKRLQDLQAQLCKFLTAMHHHMKRSAMFATGIDLSESKNSISIRAFGTPGAISTTAPVLVTAGQSDK